MKTPQPRMGTFVTIGGREYQANSHPVDGSVTIFATSAENPDPALFDKDTATGKWVATVHTADCDQIAAVTTRAYWKGHYRRRRRDAVPPGKQPGEIGRRRIPPAPTRYLRAHRSGDRTRELPRVPRRPAVRRMADRGVSGSPGQFGSMTGPQDSLDPGRCK
jgi:hypothetical protein